MKIKRVYHHYLKCEEYRSKMWKSCSLVEKDVLIKKSADLLRSADDFTVATKMVIDEWPISCEANLTASTMNHQAWLGAASCALIVDVPEDITKLAWKTLSKEQQDVANGIADQAYSYWKEKYIQKKIKEKLSA